MGGVSRLLNYSVFFIFGILFTCLVSCNSESKKNEIQPANIEISSKISDETSGDKFLDKSLYDSACLYYKKAVTELENKGDIKLQVQVLIKLAEALRLRGDIDSSMSVVLQAEGLITRSNSKDYKLLADILHKKGLLLNNKGLFDSAINVLNTSLLYKIKLFGQTDSSLSLNYNLLGIAYFYKGDYDNAQKNYQLAYDLALKRKIPEDEDLASYIQNIGIIHAQRGEYEQAEEAFTTSLTINEKFRSADDPELSMNNLNVGRLKALLNKDTEALSYYNKAEEILLKKAEKGHPYFIYVYSNKGQTYVHMADYEKAIIYFSKALALAKESLDARHPQILSLYMNIGYVYEKKGDYNNALKYYLLSIPDDKQNPSIIKTYSNLASLYNSLKNPEKADEYYKKALALAESNMDVDHPERGLLYTRYGYFLLYNRIANRELDYFNKALTISRKHYGEKSREVSNNYTHLGNYYYMQRDLTRALEYYQNAIISISGDFNNHNIYSNPDVANVTPDRYLVNALNGKAQALAETGNIKDLIEGLNTYKLSVKVIDKLRSNYQDEESKLMVSDETKFTYQMTVDVAVKLYQQTKDETYLSEAFTFSDKAKSAVLINSMHDVEAQHFSKVPSDILSLEKELKLKISTFRRFIFEEQQKPEPNAGIISNWESRVFEFTVRYDSLVGILEKNYPDYYAIKYTEPSVSIKAVQQSLGPKSVLVEYMLSDSVLHAFAIDKNTFKVFSEPIDSSFYHNIETLVAATVNNSMFSTTEKDYIKYSKAAYSLYGKLLKSVMHEFKEEKLVIIPDGEIGYISFDMLLTSLPDTTLMDYRKLDYLLREKTVSYSTSAILQYSGFRKRERNASKNLLVMAPSYDNLVQGTKRGFADENGNIVYLLPIPGIERELEGIKTSVLAKKIRGEKATEECFKDEVGKYNILHLAMHTLINNKQPMLSKLVFYQDNDTIEDGLLNTYELFSMDLNAGLAVLSACNTGSGKLLKGEGIMNLARGFIFAGVPGIVMTMWSVDDQSGADIVSKFYEYLEDGMSKDEALRQAKLDFLAKGDPLRSHPFYWAAYVNIGDNSPMKFQNAFLTYTLYAVLILLLITAGIIYYRRKHKTTKNKITQMA